MKSRLFYKIFGTYLLVIVLASLFFYLLAWQQIRTSETAKAEEILMSYARIVDLSSKEAIIKQLDRIAGVSRSRVTLIDPAGDVLADSERNPATMESHLNRPEIQEARVKGQGTAVRYSNTAGMDMIYVALPVHEDTSITGYVRLSRPLFEVKSASEKLYRSLILSILIMIIPSFLIAFISAYRLSFPITVMEHFTERLRKGQPPGSLIISTKDEMKKLADNINYLVGELQSQIRTATEEKEKLAAAFAGMNEGFLVLDAENRIETCNPACGRVFPSLSGEMTGKTLIEAIRNIELQNALDRFRKTGEQPAAEILAGEEIPAVLNVSFSKILGEDEKTIIVFHDVTRLKRLERMRSDFVANVTHEIKTPLTAILGFVETLRKGAVEERETALRFLEIIDKHANRLNRLVDDLLTLSDIELGETKFLFESVSLSGILENVLPVVAGRAAEKQIALSRDVPENLPPVRADRDRLVQILLNVLDNAVKFTPEQGEVSISAEVRNGTVAVKVSDTGVGIPAGEISRVGERFYRVDKTRSREMGGTGLGLSIVKHLMEAHGGRMDIQSRLGRGTTVTLFFPVFSGGRE